MTEVSLYNEKIVYKKLIWFHAASLALILSGFLLNAKYDFLQLTLLVWSCIAGVILVYRLNDCIDQDKELKLNIRYFLSFKLHRIILAQLIFLIIPLAFLFLDQIVFLVLSISALVGIIYSLNLKIGNKQFRLKNVFLLKNILIGLIWASLIIIGAGNFQDKIVQILFYFIALQVFIGGMIRDIPDVEKDRNTGVKTLPVVFGIPFTILFMHLINGISISLLFIVEWEGILVSVIIGTISWRALNLFLIFGEPKSAMWTQWMNLFTCVICFVFLLLSKLYEFYID
jgi:4-hydroxybenzoate polyprenyltransferase